MDVLSQFRENLNLLLQIAATEGNHVTREQVQGCFGDMELTGEQWELIYHYLEMNQVEVQDHETDAAYARQLTAAEETEEEMPGREPDERENAFFAMYLEDLEAIPPLEKGEEQELIARMLAGDSAARERLTEGKLTFTARIAREYAGRGMWEADLVQEGNLALMMALADYRDGDLDPYLEAQIRQSLERTLLEEGGQDSVGTYLAGQTNALLKLSTEMAERLGREATAEELAKAMNLPEETIKELMKMSLDAMTVVENGNLS